MTEAMKYVVGAVLIVGLLVFCSVNLVKAEKDENIKLSSDRLNPIWNTTWRDGGTEVANKMLYIPSGIFVMGNIMISNSSNNLFLLKYDLNGDLLWNKTWNENPWNVGNAMAVDNTNVYLVGSTGSFSPQGIKMLIIKYDFNGNLIWNRTQNYTYTKDYSIAIEHSSIYIAGVFNYSDVSLLRYDLDGNIISNLTWKGCDIDNAKSVLFHESYTYISGTRTLANDSNNLFIIKYDTKGNIIWNKTEMNNKGNWVEIDCIATDGSNLYISGYVGIYSASDVFLSKWDYDGNSLWNYSWNGSDQDIGYDIAFDNSNIYLTGKTLYPSSGSINLLVLKYDKNGMFLWNKTWSGASNSAEGRSITVDGNNIYISGWSYENTSSGWDALLLKTDLNGGNTVPDLPPFIVPAVFMVAVFIVITRRKKE